MKILRKATTPDGIEIQLEDWSEDYSCFAYGSLIAAYPKPHLRIRSELDLDSHTKALLTFEKLVAGTARVIDLDFTFMKNSRREPIKPLLEKYQKYSHLTDEVQ